MQLLNQLFKDYGHCLGKCSFTEILVQEKKMQYQKAFWADGKWTTKGFDLVEQLKEGPLVTWQGTKVNKDLLALTYLVEGGRNSLCEFIVNQQV